jgi:hypothetical protein
LSVTIELIVTASGSSVTTSGAGRVGRSGSSLHVDTVRTSDIGSELLAASLLVNQDTELDLLTVCNERIQTQLINLFPVDFFDEFLKYKILEKTTNRSRI